MSTQSAHKSGFIATIRQKLAHWLHEPLQETPWQASRYWGYPDTPALAAQSAPVPGQPIEHVALIDGIAGAPRWPGPSGTWSAIYTHRQPHRRCETGAMAQLRPAILLPAPEVAVPLPTMPGRTATEDLFLLDAADMQPDLTEIDDDATIEHPRTRANKKFQQAIVGLQESE